MALTELTKRMQAALNDTVVSFLAEQGFRGGLSGFRRQREDRTDLMRFDFGPYANMAYRVICAPVFPGREPLREEGNIDPYGYEPQKPLRIGNAWVQWCLQGFRDQSFGYFYYGHVFRDKHFLPDGKYEPSYASYTDRQLQYFPWVRQPPWEKLYEPDDASCRRIAEETLRQTQEMVSRLDQMTCCREWREFQLLDQFRRMSLYMNPKAIEQTVENWYAHHAGDPELISRVFERWKQTVKQA